MYLPSSKGAFGQWKSARTGHGVAQHRRQFRETYTWQHSWSSKCPDTSLLCWIRAVICLLVSQKKSLEIVTYIYCFLFCFLTWDGGKVFKNAFFFFFPLQVSSSPAYFSTERIIYEISCLLQEWLCTLGWLWFQVRNKWRDQTLLEE